MLAQVEISRLEQEKIQEIEQMRKRMVKVTNEAALTVLGLKNDLAELERSYNQARTECSKWEKIMANAKDTVANHDLNKDRALDGIHYMYRLLCKRRSMMCIKYFTKMSQILFGELKISLLRQMFSILFKKKTRNLFHFRSQQISVTDL